MRLFTKRPANLPSEKPFHTVAARISAMTQFIILTFCHFPPILFIIFMLNSSLKEECHACNHR